MSIHQGLFYAKRLGNYIYCKFKVGDLSFEIMLRNRRSSIVDNDMFKYKLEEEPPALKRIFLEELGSLRKKYRNSQEVPIHPQLIKKK